MPQVWFITGSSRGIGGAGFDSVHAEIRIPAARMSGADDFRVTPRPRRTLLVRRDGRTHAKRFTTAVRVRAPLRRGAMGGPSIVRAAHRRRRLVARHSVASSCCRRGPRLRVLQPPDVAVAAGRPREGREEAASHRSLTMS